VQGYFNYYAVPGNLDSMGLFWGVPSREMTIVVDISDKNTAGVDISAMIAARCHGSGLISHAGTRPSPVVWQTFARFPPVFYTLRKHRSRQRGLPSCCLE
jgi:hypothetical protein